PTSPSPHPPISPPLLPSTATTKSLKEVEKILNTEEGLSKSIYEVSNFTNQVSTNNDNIIILKWHV
ncbi:hypothetical protein, partial [Fischerella thermalis]|uniref:hypothetical protein n=1 Tax=Fischerella thermalis TaxID=372787 RepID=UPI001CA4F2C1